MFRMASTFLAGALYLQTFALLPSLALLLFLFALSLLPLFFVPKSYSYYLLPLFIFSLIYTTWFAEKELAWSLPKNLESQPLLIRGYIDSLPLKDAFGNRFIFWMESFEQENKKILAKRKIKLTWPGSKTLKVGDKWQLWVKLKRIHGLQSPGAFDFEAWALQKGLRASGVVLTDRASLKIGRADFYYFIDSLRQILQEKILAHLPNAPTSPWLLALIMGERNGIDQNDWQVLRNTGTNHLMAIAGLHIGIIAGFVYALTLWSVKRIPWLILRIPGKDLATFAAFLTALFYSALAGFSLPTERASFMFSILTLALLLRKKQTSLHIWSLALILVLLINPLSVLSQSFWLSFGTILLIIYGMNGRIKPQGFWWKWGRVQWVVGLGLLPFTFFLFQQSSLISFLANCIAIPLLSFLILPFCLLSVIFLFIYPTLGALLLSLAAQSLSALWWVLEQFASLPFAALHQGMPNYRIFALTLFGFLLLLLPSGFKGKWLGIFFLLPFIFYETAKPKMGEVWLTLLDVGQGLSVLVETKHHVLLYDAGSRIGKGLDMGENIVLPYLYQARIKHLDKIIISHGDNDHLGGVFSVLKALTYTSILTSVPDKMPDEKAGLCLSGYSWQWDQVKFSFLHPTLSDQGLGNDSSCVLRIDNGLQQILLTGDIEEASEKKLLHRHLEQLPSTILVAPHHGSKTSSTKDFVLATKPVWVLYATGYRNRYRLPHNAVVAKFKGIASYQLNTAETGTMQFKLEKDTKNISVFLYRETHKRYWHLKI